MADIHNGSDCLIVFASTYTAPTGSTGWGTLTGCKVMPFETSNGVTPTIESEDLEYKAGLSVTMADKKSTVTETVVNKVSYEISGSTYANKGAVSEGQVSVDQLRTMAYTGDEHIIAVIRRPASAGSTTPTTADGWVALWAGDNGPDLIMSSTITSWSETEDVKTHVKVDMTFKQAGEILFRRDAAWS